MTVTVEPIAVTAQPVVVTAQPVPDPLTIDVNNPNPVTVDVSSAIVGVDVTGSVLTSLTVGVPGPQGTRGPGGSGSTVFGETPTGVLDGVNAVFTTSTAFAAGGTAVYLNGVREHFYTETSPTTVRFDTAPLLGDIITIDYLIP